MGSEMVPEVGLDRVFDPILFKGRVTSGFAWKPASVEWYSAGYATVRKDLVTLIAKLPSCNSEGLDSSGSAIGGEAESLTGQPTERLPRTERRTVSRISNGPYCRGLSWSRTMVKGMQPETLCRHTS